MLHIKCPYCGLRDEVEFSCGGEAHIKRPVNPSQLNDKEWSEYLFSRYNPKGVFIERWVHSSGCRRWFNVVRNTISNEIYEVYGINNDEYKLGNIYEIADTLNIQITKKHILLVNETNKESKIMLKLGEELRL